jgi:hypothetical protein
MKKYLFFICLCCALMLAACGSPKTGAGRAAIRPPFKGVDIAFHSYTIDANKRSVIRTKTGTEITIPANSLTDADGNPISGKVNLRFREIHTPVEILASGIPMRYDSLGKGYDFVSAGMFEIAAEQNDESLAIKEGQQINVSLASFKEGNDFSFYRLDTENGDWSNIGIAAADTNDEKAKSLKAFKDNNLIAFDIDYSANPELGPFNGINWTYVGTDKKSNPLKNKWILKERWRTMRLSSQNKKTGAYTITLANSKKSVAMEMAPYFLENQQQEMEAFASMVENYHTLVEQQKAEEGRIQLEADLTRSFPISEFGLYNWDKIDKIVQEEQLAVVNASFSVDGKPLEAKSQVYFINGKEKLLARETLVWDKLVYQPKEKNWIVLVLPDNRAAVCGAGMFRRVKDEAKAVFELKTAPGKIRSVEDIKKLLKAV